MYGGRDITVAMKDNDFRLHMRKLDFTECLKPDMPPILQVIMQDVANIYF